MALLLSKDINTNIIYIYLTGNEKGQLILDEHECQVLLTERIQSLISSYDDKIKHTVGMMYGIDMMYVCVYIINITLLV